MSTGSAATNNLRVDLERDASNQLCRNFKTWFTLQEKVKKQLQQ